MRKACAKRLATRLLAPESTLPPEIFVPGHRPSQEAKCLTVLKRDRSGPTSAIIFNAVPTSMPSIRVRSTPQARYGGVYPNVLNDAVSIANCLILWDFEISELHSN